MENKIPTKAEIDFLFWQIMFPLRGSFLSTMFSQFQILSEKSILQFV
jgi:hypothetical protein